MSHKAFAAWLLGLGLLFAGFAAIMARPTELERLEASEAATIAADDAREAAQQ